MILALSGKVALVTGASRGVGRGVALGLGEVGATVYVTGRTIDEATAPEQLPGTIHSTAAKVTALGGKGIAIPCDHRDDVATQDAFNRVLTEAGRLDILVNSAWAGYERMIQNGRFTWPDPFWHQPAWRWNAMFDSGVRAAYVASGHAAKVMTQQRNGLIVNISSWASQKYIGNVAYGAAKAATDKMTRDMARELRDYNVSVIGLYPGLVRTENVMRFAEALDLSNSESPQFIGRAVAALASDRDIARKSGEILVAARLEYGFTDLDGSRPMPLTLETA